MRVLLSQLAPMLALMSVASTAGAQRQELKGEWSGTLVLDNSSPQVRLEFEQADSVLTGKVYTDGDLMGAMEKLTVHGDTVHFNVGRLDFTGVVSGNRMSVDLIVYNGTTRHLRLTKVPPLNPPRRAPMYCVASSADVAILAKPS